MRKLAWLIGFLLSFVQARGQDNDSIQVFSFDAFYAYVIANHPIVKQAELLPANAAQQLRLARGSFDPKLEGSWDYKDFKDTEYFNKASVGLKIPTWFPVDPKVEFARNSGEFLDSESSISDATNNQQIYAGVSIPIGQGLFIDQRRATVKQAKIFQDMAQVEQIKQINKILLTSAKDYWQWYFAYENYELIRQSIQIAQDIFDRTLTGYQYGETAAVDTIQAKIALQSRQVEFQQANIERIKAALQLSNHLWNAQGLPLEIVNNVRPQNLSSVNTVTEDLLGQLVSLARENHPEIVKLGLKNESLTVDKRLARENLKPRLDLDYAFIDQPLNPQGEVNGLNIGEDYKLGMTLAFPLFLRKERAKLKQIDLKLQENSFELNFREREIVNEINARYSAVLTTSNILQQQQEMVQNYQLILNAERLNLENGESDLFKINVQFDKLINSQTKLFKLRSEYQKSIAKLYWAAGIPNLGLDGVQ